MVTLIIWFTLLLGAALILTQAAVSVLPLLTDHRKAKTALVVAETALTEQESKKLLIEQKRFDQATFGATIDDGQKAAEEPTPSSFSKEFLTKLLEKLPLVAAGIFLILLAMVAAKVIDVNIALGTGVALP